MDKIKNFNVNMDVLSYMKRMKDDNISTFEGLLSGNERKVVK